jgi:hypothetical protein
VKLFFNMILPFYTSTSNIQDSELPHLISPIFLMLIIPVGTKRFVNVALIYISLMGNNFEHLFICLLDLHMYTCICIYTCKHVFSYEVSVQIFWPFLIGSFLFALLSEFSLYTPLVDACVILQIFSLVVWFDYSNFYRYFLESQNFDFIVWIWKYESSTYRYHSF